MYHEDWCLIIFASQGSTIHSARLICCREAQWIINPWLAKMIFSLEIHTYLTIFLPAMEVSVIQFHTCKKFIKKIIKISQCEGRPKKNNESQSVWNFFMQLQIFLFHETGDSVWTLLVVNILLQFISNGGKFLGQRFGYLFVKLVEEKDFPLWTVNSFCSEIFPGECVC